MSNIKLNEQLSNWAAGIMQSMDNLQEQIDVLASENAELKKKIKSIRVTPEATSNA